MSEKGVLDRPLPKGKGFTVQRIACERCLGTGNAVLLTRSGVSSYRREVCALCKGTGIDEGGEE